MNNEALQQLKTQIAEELEKLDKYIYRNLVSISVTGNEIDIVKNVNPFGASDDDEGDDDETECEDINENDDEGTATIRVIPIDACPSSYNIVVTGERIVYPNEREDFDIYIGNFSNEVDVVDEVVDVFDRMTIDDDLNLIV